MVNRYMVKPGTRVRLADYDPDDDGGLSKDDPAVQRKLQEDLDVMRALQERMFAEGKQSLLIVLQAMDTGGKDGTIKHVMSGLNPGTCDVTAFKQPTTEELAHDFLWRVHQRTPPKGIIMVFNRSHYEDVLVVRVHKLVPPAVWRTRYQRINEFEALLAENGTRILKFYLHISKQEQKARLQERLSDPTKYWKFAPGDLDERKLWNRYMAAYEDALTKCSTKVAPWYIIPANRKWYRNYLVADIVARTMEEMNPKWPPAKVDLSRIVLK